MCARTAPGSRAKLAVVVRLSHAELAVMEDILASQSEL